MQHFLERFSLEVLFWCKACNHNKEHQLHFEKLRVRRLACILALGLGFESWGQIQVLSSDQVIQILELLGFESWG